MALQPFYPRGTPRDPVPLSDAAESTLVAAERLMKDWVALARLEAVDAVKSGATTGALFGAAAFLALVAWLAVSIAGGVLLTRWLPADAAAALVAAANAGLAGGLVARALHRPRQREDA